ncbi:hypothetical protein [Thermocoleostomius sinensis]|jgi:hypothetical protein|uniref:Uncharacterized protein n=1 Tax=Thermocoleostomius sinensis A174 TaxID=2016057 RepID=A0A9E8ZI21_9CYAN|nr:hypothetical protein [Thermocoleostomius sinensis]WAL58901.1 hypothetical protein OXH18_17205 [Thermocoleostomius sinensis A174]
MTNWTVYQALELIPDEALKHIQSSENTSWICRSWARLKTALTKPTIPFVWKTISESGHVYWNIFDAKTGRTTLLLSAEEFETWLTYCFRI